MTAPVYSARRDEEITALRKHVAECGDIDAVIAELTQAYAYARGHVGKAEAAWLKVQIALAERRKREREA